MASYLWPLRLAAMFLYIYVVRGGFLDGPPALLFCLRHAVYEYMAAEKIIEQRWRRRGPPVASALLHAPNAPSFASCAGG
jgi:hypothetical protein